MPNAFRSAPAQKRAPGPHAQHLLAQVDAPEPIAVTLTPEDLEKDLEKALEQTVTFYGPAGPVEVTLTPEERAEIIERYTGEAPDTP